MTPNNKHLNEYRRVMSYVDIEESVKQQIIKNCARYSTLNKIKSGKFRVVAIIKEKTTHTL